MNEPVSLFPLRRWLASWRVTLAARLPGISPLFRPLTLRQGLIAFMLLTVGMALALELFWLTMFIRNMEYEGWQAREADVAYNAVNSVDRFLQRTTNVLDYVVAIDPALLAANPSLLDFYVRPESDLLELIRVDEDGAIVAAAYDDEPALAAAFTLPQSNWFLTAQAGHKYIGNVQLSADKTAYITMAKPTPDGGVVAARVEMQVLWDVLTKMHLGKTGIVYVTDGTGRILAHPRGELVVNMTTLPNWADFNTQQNTETFGWQGVFLDIAGNPVVANVARVPETDWYVIAEIQQHEVYATGRIASLWISALILSFGLLIALVLVNRANAWILTPIERLRAGAERLGAGELDFRVQVGVRNELGEVAQTFNRMAAQLEKHTGSLVAQQSALAEEVIQRRQAQAALQVARDQALDASRTKSEFLATMSHEIRTPMHGIIGTTELLAATKLTEDQVDFVHTITSSAGTLLTLLNDILDLSKIEAGRLSLNLHVFNVREEVENVLGLFTAIAHQKGIDLQSSFAPNTPDFIVGDSGRVRQVLLNLVGNAVKFTDHGSVTVAVSPNTLIDGQTSTYAFPSSSQSTLTTTADMPTDMPTETATLSQPDVTEGILPESVSEHPSIRFEVIDTGVGIAKADCEELFQPFKQLTGTASTKRGGTGLGLSISRRLAELMGGKVGLTSLEGHGSTFWFDVPFAVADANRYPTTDHAARHLTATAAPVTAPTEGNHNALYRPTSKPDATTLHSLSILVAEDNLVNQKLIMRQLVNLGIAADLVPNGEEAVAAFSARHYDLILMDCQMPEMNGYDATRAIRKLESATDRRVPIIAMTANAMESDREASVQAGMDGFLVKPFRSNDLNQLLIQWSILPAQLSDPS